MPAELVSSLRTEDGEDWEEPVTRERCDLLGAGQLVVVNER